MDTPVDLPTNRPLSDSELSIAVARAILDDRQNPGSNLPFHAHGGGLLARLGVGQSSDLLQANPGLDLRLAEYCWRLVGLGFFVPQMGGDYGVFHLTERGREFLRGMDATALTADGLDAKLAILGYAHQDLPRQYARLAQECFLAGHYESSVVMLGVASEAVILALGDALSVVQARLMRNAAPRPAVRTARQDLVWVGDTLSTYRKVIRQALDAVAAESQWIEPLRDLLAGTAQMIRLSRNDFGHPTGITATQEDALQLLTLFPRFAEAATRAKESLAQI